MVDLKNTIYKNNIKFKEEDVSLAKHTLTRKGMWRDFYQFKPYLATRKVRYPHRIFTLGNFEYLIFTTSGGNVFCYFQSILKN